MTPRRWQLGWKVMAGYALVAVAVAATGWAAARQVSAAHSASDRARYALGVLRQIGALEIGLLNAESGQRGFLITGEDAYLEPYRRAAADVSAALDALHTLTANRPAQQERLTLVGELSAAKLSELQQVIELRRSQGSEAALQAVTTHVGKGIMDRIRTLLAGMEAEETALLDRRSDERGDSFWWASRVAVISSGLALIVVALSVLTANADARRRAASEREREQLRREETARLAAERDSRTKDEFLAILSHELRSPLQGILGWLTVLRETSPNAEQQDRALQAIERGVRQQAQLVNDILDVSRIVAGKLQLERVPVDLVPVVEDCIDEALPQAQAKHIQLQSKVMTCGLVLGDLHRLRQAIANLLANAIKFTPAGGRVDVHCQRDEGSVIVTVRDSGQGIAPAFLPHIFDRFTQGDTGPRPAISGLGLGLSIVRQIAEVHGGSVCAESAGLGHGATFTVRLPAAPAAATAPATPSQPAASPSTLRGLSILVVDDDADTRESLSLLLGVHGAAVRQAESVAAALDECARQSPAVIISDISMPEQDGYALIDELRRRDSAPQPIALALTGFAGDNERDRAIEAGFDAYVSKPIDLDALMTTILNLAAMH